MYNEVDEFQEFVFSSVFDSKFTPENRCDLERIYHYTSAQGFLSILGNSDNLELWASQYDCLNDKSEGTVALEVYREVCSDLLKEKLISEEHFQIYNSIEPAKNIFLCYSTGDSIESCDAICDRYVCSFSKNPDSLSMWNYYSKGSKYEGFNIGTSTFMLNEAMRESMLGKKHNVGIYDVIYDREQQKTIIRDFIIKMEEFFSDERRKTIVYTISTQLVTWGLVFKYEYFYHEEEVRVILDIPRDSKEFDVKYRIANGLIIPYVVLQLEKNTLESVSFGPLNCVPEQRERQIAVMQQYLSNHGYSAQVNYSGVPVRF